jgi:hypothetical protein
MNVWALDDDPVQAAAWMCDGHIVHAPYNCAQMLSTVWRWYVKHPPHTPRNWPADKPFLLPGLDLEQPWVRWVMKCDSNYMWYAKHAEEACRQYHLRFGKRHLYAAVCGVLNKPPYALRKWKRTEFPYPVEVCRVMYTTFQHACWWHTEPPPFWGDYRR